MYIRHSIYHSINEKNYLADQQYFGSALIHRQYIAHDPTFMLQLWIHKHAHAGKQVFNYFDVQLIRDYACSQGNNCSINELMVRNYVLYARVRELWS